MILMSEGFIDLNPIYLASIGFGLLLLLGVWISLIVAGIVGAPCPVLSSAKDLSEAARAVSFHAEDGVRIRGYYSPPAAGRPVLVLQHGQGSCRDTVLPWARIFAAVGYGVLCFDWRAHGRSGGWCVHYGAHEYKDLLAGIRFLESQPEARGRPVGVYACSLGAACTAMAAPGLPESVKALVLDSPFGSFSRMIEHRTARLKSWQGLVRLVIESLAVYLSGAPTSAVVPEDNLKAFQPRPILVFHGSRDGVIPVEEGRSLFGAYGGPKDYWESDDGHVRARRTRTREFMQRISEFFERHLEGAPAPEEVLKLTPEQIPGGIITLRRIFMGNPE